MNVPPGSALSVHPDGNTVGKYATSKDPVFPRPIKSVNPAEWTVKLKLENGPALGFPSKIGC
jgi:hypothetical protein